MKQSYVIDGYNLLHAMGVLLGKVVAPQGLERARRRLLSELAKLFEADVGQLTVVFDGSAAPRYALADQQIQGIRVLFALGDKKADDVIEGLISRHPHPEHLAVVSDDHRLQRAARRRHAQDMSCGTFLDVLEQCRQHQKEGAPLPAASTEEAKETQISQAETQHWLTEFGHLQHELDRHDLPVKLDKLPPTRSS